MCLCQPSPQHRVLPCHETLKLFFLKSAQLICGGGRDPRSLTFVFPKLSAGHAMFIRSWGTAVPRAAPDEGEQRVPKGVDRLTCVLFSHNTFYSSGVTTGCSLMQTARGSVRVRREFKEVKTQSFIVQQTQYTIIKLFAIRPPPLAGKRCVYVIFAPLRLC